MRTKKVALVIAFALFGFTFSSCKARDKNKKDGNLDSIDRVVPSPLGTTPNTTTTTPDDYSGDPVSSPDEMAEEKDWATTFAKASREKYHLTYEKIKMRGLLGIIHYY